MTAFTDRIASTLDSLIESRGAHVIFMPTYNVDHENDYEVCVQTSEMMQHRHSSIMQINDPGLYKAITGELSVVLCGRMHPAILAAGLGTPIIGLAYNQKFSGSFDLLGLSDRCLSMSDFCLADSKLPLTEWLLDCIDRPEANRPNTNALEQRTASYIRNLAETISDNRASALEH